MNGVIKFWIKKEFETLSLNNARLERRLQMVTSDLWENPSKSIWLASGSRTNAKAVYRMLANEDFRKESILSAHRDATAVRAEKVPMLLAVQDTMSVNYNGHEKTEGMGYICEQTKGLKVHSCLLITPEGIPLGVVAQSVATRKEASDKSMTRDKKRLRPIEEKESFRWLETMNIAAENAPKNSSLIHIADREGDIYELFALADKSDQKFVIRAVHDRKNRTNEHIKDKLNESMPVGKTKITIPANRQKSTKEREAILAVRYEHFDVQKPQIRKYNSKTAHSVKLCLISLKEESPPDGLEPIEWLLMTNLQIENASDAIDAADYYNQRWKIERFHFVLKSGCEIEKIQQRSIDGIENMLLLYSIISVHIMQLTFISRQFPHTPCELIFAKDEWATLYRAANRTTQSPEMPYSMEEAVYYVAKLGGFSGVKSDGPPGLKVIWLGLNALYILNAYREYI